jgi:predicted acylesterase/phospholipase RssA
VPDPPPRLARRLRGKRKVALVCAGGGVTGAVYEIGCLRALEDLLDRSVLDFDIYVGVSGGAFVTSLLANGITPHDMYEELVGRTRRPFGITAADIYRLGLGDVVRRSLRAPRVLGDALVTTLTGEGRNLSDFALSLFELLPAGLLDNSGIQQFLERLFRAEGGTDSFARLRRELLIVAVDLDSGEAVTFGEPDRMGVPVSRAVQASTALPGLYRPVRIHGRDYVDGGVKKTAHIHLAIQHGADLVVCINPIVPFGNDTLRSPLGGHLSNKGVTYVLDQVLRIMLHGRMQYGLERYEHEHPEVDILVLEPLRDDLRMFTYNIMRYSARRVVAEHGYRSVREAFLRPSSPQRRLLARHGIGVLPPRRVPDPPGVPGIRSGLARDLQSSLATLDHKLRSSNGRPGRRPARRAAGGATANGRT